MGYHHLQWRLRILCYSPSSLIRPQKYLLKAFLRDTCSRKLKKYDREISQKIENNLNTCPRITFLSEFRFNLNNCYLKLIIVISFAEDLNLQCMISACFARIYFYKLQVSGEYVYI